MKSRNELGSLFQSHLEKGIGAEIGVQNGFNCLNIFKSWTGQILCVDKWEDNYILGNCVKTLNDHNYKIIVGNSVDIAKQIPDKSLDFVYIDAGHTLKDIQEDYAAWWPKVRDGGIVAGHDYGNNGFGIKKFIDDLRSKGMHIRLTTDDFWEGIEYQTWWTFKPLLTQ